MIILNRISMTRSHRIPQRQQFGLIASLALPFSRDIMQRYRFRRQGKSAPLFFLQLLPEPLQLTFAPSFQFQSFVHWSQFHRLEKQLISKPGEFIGSPLPPAGISYKSSRIHTPTCVSRNLISNLHENKFFTTSNYPSPADVATNLVFARPPAGAPSKPTLLYEPHGVGGGINLIFNRHLNKFLTTSTYASPADVEKQHSLLSHYINRVFSYNATFPVLHKIEGDTIWKRANTRFAPPPAGAPLKSTTIQAHTKSATVGGDLVFARNIVFTKPLAAALFKPKRSYEPHGIGGINLIFNRHLNKFLTASTYSKPSGLGTNLVLTNNEIFSFPENVGRGDAGKRANTRFAPTHVDVIPKVVGEFAKIQRRIREYANKYSIPPNINLMLARNIVSAPPLAGALSKSTTVYTSLRAHPNLPFTLANFPTYLNATNIEKHFRLKHLENITQSFPQLSTITNIASSFNETSFTQPYEHTTAFITYLQKGGKGVVKASNLEIASPYPPGTPGINRGAEEKTASYTGTGKHDNREAKYHPSMPEAPGFETKRLESRYTHAFLLHREREEKEKSKTRSGTSDSPGHIIKPIKKEVSMMLPHEQWLSSKNSISRGKQPSPIEEFLKKGRDSFIYPGLSVGNSISPQASLMNHTTPRPMMKHFSPLAQELSLSEERIKKIEKTIVTHEKQLENRLNEVVTGPGPGAGTKNTFSQSSAPLPGAVMKKLADGVYDMLIDRIKRERSMRGY